MALMCSEAPVDRTRWTLRLVVGLPFTRPPADRLAPVADERRRRMLPLDSRRRHTLSERRTGYAHRERRTPSEASERRSIPA